MGSVAKLGPVATVGLFPTSTNLGPSPFAPPPRRTLPAPLSTFPLPTMQNVVPPTHDVPVVPGGSGGDW
jgi:hypothetical protein